MGSPALNPQPYPHANWLRAGRGSVSIWVRRAPKGLKRMHLLCAAHTLTPSGALSAQIPTRVRILCTGMSRDICGLMCKVGCGVWGLWCGTKGPGLSVASWFEVQDLGGGVSDMGRTVCGLGFRV